MADTAATIVDLCAYRARRRAAAVDSRNESRRGVTGTFPVAFYYYWPVLVWMPIPLPAMSGIERGVL